MFTKTLLPDTLRAIQLISAFTEIKEADLAAMKIHAIEDRGTRRDFVDVYFLSKKYSLEEMLGFYQKKYAVLEDHLYSILRALDYFEDAEREKLMPNMLVPINWEEVKEYFRKETGRLAEKKLQI